MPSSPTFFLGATAVASRETEVPDASWDTGMNYGGSNAPGVGINLTDPATPIVDEPQQFTELDQDGDPRTPQVSGHLSHAGWVPNGDYPSSGGVEGKSTVALRVAINGPGDGSITLDGEPFLNDPAIGWENAAPV